MLSSLEQAELGKIWGMVDSPPTGRIDYKQFGQPTLTPRRLFLAARATFPCRPVAVLLDFIAGSAALRANRWARAVVLTLKRHRAVCVDPAGQILGLIAQGQRKEPYDIASIGPNTAAPALTGLN